MPWPAIGAIGAGVLGLIGSERANRQNRREAARNRAFQERMRATQYQTAVADMEAAGLNPALAYKAGGAGTPSGAVAPAHENVASSALQVSHLRKSIDLLNEQVSKTRQEGKAAKAAADVATDRANYLRDRGELILPDGRRVRGVPRLIEMVDAEVDQARYGATNTAALADRNRELARIAGPMGDLSERLGEWLPVLGLAGTAGAGGASALARLLSARKRKTILNRKVTGGLSDLGARLGRSLRRRR